MSPNSPNKVMQICIKYKCNRFKQKRSSVLVIWM